MTVRLELSVIEDLARAKTVPAASAQETEATLDRLAEMGNDLPHLPYALPDGS